MTRGQKILRVLRAGVAMVLFALAMMLEAIAAVVEDDRA